MIPLSAVDKMLMRWGQDWVEIVITTIQEKGAFLGLPGIQGGVPS